MARALSASPAGDHAQRRTARALARTYSALASRASATAAELEVGLPAQHRTAVQSRAQHIARTTTLTFSQAIDLVRIHGPDLDPATATRLHQEMP